MAEVIVRWYKFRRVFRDNPDVAAWLKRHIGSPMLVSAPLNFLPGTANSMLRRHVRDKLSHIAIRGPGDFDTLNLRSGNSYRDKLDSDRGSDPGYNGEKRIRTYIDYTVRFHIAGSEDRGSRLAYVDNGDYRGECEPCFSIEAVIESRKAWHKLYWAKLGYALRFDAVVRRTRVWEVGDYGDKLLSESLDIFRLPENYTFPGPDLPRQGMM